MADRATASRAELLATLRAARERRGFTQERAAAALGCRQGKINKIETGRTSIKPGDLEAMLRLYHVPDEEATELRALAALAGPAGTGPSSTYLQMLTLERQATEILGVYSERIPKPLQCDSYLLTQYQRAGHTEVKPKDLLLDRAERARIFTRENPVRYRVVLSESALHRMPGGRTPALVLDQAGYFLHIARKHQNVDIQILTFDADVPFLDADATVLTFGADRNSAVYYEHGAREYLVKDTKTVAEHEKQWNVYHEAALSPAESVEFLDDLARRTGPR